MLWISYSKWNLFKAPVIAVISLSAHAVKSRVIPIRMASNNTITSRILLSIQHIIQSMGGASEAEMRTE